MRNSQKNTANIFNKRQSKYKQLVLKNIINDVERGTNLSLYELKEKYTEEQLFYVGLKHTTTTKKAYCKALNIPIEAGCRYKRKLEILGYLKESIKDVVCPYTNHLAKEISTNPKEFERLRNSNQLKMF